MRKMSFAFAIVLLSGVAQAQTPFKAGATTVVPVGQAADISVSPPEGAGMLLKVYPAPNWKAPNLTNRTIFLGTPGVKYQIDAQYFSYNDVKKQVEVKEETQYLTFGGSIEPPVKDPPVKDPDIIPPPTPKKFYFLVVRADGPADPAFTQKMADPNWATLRSKGHQVKDKTVTEAAALGIRVTSTPSVVTLVVSADGKSSTIYRAGVPLPSGADILKLAEVTP